MNPERGRSEEPVSRCEVTLAGLVAKSVETARVLVQAHLPLKPSAFTLVGLAAAFAETFDTFTFRDNPDLTRYVLMARFAARTNDLIDMIPIVLDSDDSSDGAIVQRHFRDVQIERRATLARLRGLENGRELHHEAINHYMEEISLLNREERQKPQGSHSVSEVLIYRELESAISLVHLSAMIIDEQELRARIGARIPERSIEGLVQKYRWITEGKPATQTEHRLCMLFNLSMGLQISDDLTDVADDTALGLTTPATVVLCDTGGDREETEKRLSLIANNYYTKAEGFGATRGATKGVDITYRLVKFMMHSFPGNLGGPREQLLAELRRE